MFFIQNVHLIYYFIYLFLIKKKLLKKLRKLKK